MAKAAAKGKAKGKGKGKVKGKARRGAASDGRFLTPANKLLIFLTLLALVPFSLPTLILLFVGMLPTVAAAIAPRSAGRNAWMSVGGLNFAGLSNWLITLWFGHHTIEYAIGLLRSVVPLLVAYAAAGLGWMIYLAMPPLVGTFMAATSQRRVTALVAQQRKLVEIWGEGVAAREAPARELGEREAETGMMRG